MNETFFIFTFFIYFYFLIINFSILSLLSYNLHYYLYANQDLSVSQKHSISVPLGKVKITRKVSELTIIVRSYTSTQIDKSKIMLDQNKSRIFEKQKIEYTLRTINSLIISCKNALKSFKDLKINLLITDDNSSKENLKLIENLLNFLA